MRTTLLSIFLLLNFLLLFTVDALSQVTERRRIPIKTIDKDSLHIPLNEEYYLTEASCVQIIRRARFNRESRTFYGDFVDVSSTDTSIILSRGSYTSNGQKTGPFVHYYSNGKLRAKGNFNHDEFEGEWQLFYESGEPKLSFYAKEGDIRVIEAWDENGKQVVSNGNGKYTAKNSAIHWNGNLKDSKPDGTWRAQNSADRTNTVLLTEKFKGGQLVKGTGPLGSYTTASRIIWIDPTDFPFLKADKMTVSPYPCDSAKPKRYVSVQYSQGLPAYSEEMNRKLKEYLSTVDLKPYDTELMITGEVSEQGRLINLEHRSAFNERIASGIIKVLNRLPLLEPALEDEKPITQKFEIRFKFTNGFYSFTYRFLPLQSKNS